MTRVQDADRRWAGRARMFVDDAADAWTGAGGFGVLHDDLTARIDAEATLGALRAACRAQGAELLDGWTWLGAHGGWQAEDGRSDQSLLEATEITPY